MSLGGKMKYSKELFVDIDSLVKPHIKVYAHSSDEKEKETLAEHTKLCQNYFYKLIEEKKLEPILLQLEEIYFSEVSEDISKIYRKLFMNSIVFHDMGKCNPIFQELKMHHKQKELIGNPGVGSKHALLSSALYIDYFLDDLIKLKGQDRSFLIYFLMLNSYIISRHHVGFNDFLNYVTSFISGAGRNILEAIEIDEIAAYTKNFTLNNKKMEGVNRVISSVMKSMSKVKSTYIYAYTKCLYSLIVASDYFATTEYYSNVTINDFGNLDRIRDFVKVYEETEINQSIRKYEKTKYGHLQGKDIDNINMLRSELFLDVEKKLECNMDGQIYYLEAPTGSGKSNLAMNISFKLLNKNPQLNKIYYVYPYNTLIDQNIHILEKTFENNEKLLQDIAVINSTYPIKNPKFANGGLEKEGLGGSKQEEDSMEYYKKALLDRQFLNYPMILTTHVSLFNMLFGSNKESAFGFYQLANSVIVLDEIQSYKNTIWTEIITFLSTFSKLLNCKIIIMSATLPNLSLLMNDKFETVHLLAKRDKYFLHPLFQKRVSINYDLLDKKADLNELHKHIQIISINEKKKILVEFINKTTATLFYNNLKIDTELLCPVELITGDDNIADRSRILNKVRGENKEGIILISTQVIEAGVDIDMDIGYKDYSLLDSDEQFMGRIHRSRSVGQGTVYFFASDKVEKIYRNDFRSNKELTLLAPSMRKILEEKDFRSYYLKTFDLLKTMKNESFGESNLDDFFKEGVACLDYKKVSERMRLIDDDKSRISIFLGRKIMINGEEVDGRFCWETYKSLLNNHKMDYSEKKIKLYNIKASMNYFTYQIRKDSNLIYSDLVGDLYYIENGEQYFDDGKLNRDRLKNAGCLFLDI